VACLEQAVAYKIVWCTHKQVVRFVGKMSYETQEEKQRDKSWSEVKRLTAEGNMAAFMRSVPMLASYFEFRDKIKTEYVSMEAYVAQKVFQAPLVTAPDGRQDLDQGQMNKWSGNHGAPRIITFIENDFPYALEPGIKHMVLWSNSELAKDDVLTTIAESVETWKNQDGVLVEEYVYFENPAHLKTIPGIFHVHVFIKYAENK
jgi:hypothetical protein